MNIHADKPKENAVSIQRQESQSMVNPNFQKKSNSKSIFQFKDNRSNSTKQLKIQEIANNSRQVDRTTQLQSAANNYSAGQQPSIHKTIPTTKQEENKTGMPDNLKSGIENLSGLDMSDVKVHYNSPQPAQLQAHAFAQGNQIHIASGQERHLPHEAWHVVQQKQGRVAPTKQLKGKVNINDNVGLEKEADVMGAKALTTNGIPPTQLKSTSNSNVAQLAKMIYLQNHPTAHETRQVNEGAKYYGAQVIHQITQFIASGERIGKDEDIIIVGHGNTELIGDEEDVFEDTAKTIKTSIDLSANQIAKLLLQIVPEDYSGNITLRVCHGADLQEDGGPSMGERVSIELLAHGRNALVHAYQGEIDGAIHDKAKTRIGKRNLLLRNAMRTYGQQPNRGARKPNKKIREKAHKKFKVRVTRATKLIQALKNKRLRYVPGTISDDDE